jgi:hypothetical protein
MEYIINNRFDDYQVILFEFENRNWEIALDNGLSEISILLHISNRINELTSDFTEHNSYDYSDLYVDYTTKKEN